MSATTSRVVSMSFNELRLFATECGHDAATGNDGIFRLASECMYFGATEVASPSVIQAFYSDYADAQNTSGYGRKIDLSNKKSVVVSASKLGSFAKIGALGYFSLPDRVAAIVDGTKQAQSMYETVVKVNRAQIKAPNAMLTDAEIAAVLETEAPEADTAIKFIDRTRKAMTKLAKELGGREADEFNKLQAAMTALMGAWEGNPDVTIIIDCGDTLEDNTPTDAEVLEAEFEDIEDTTVGVPQLDNLLSHFAKH